MCCDRFGKFALNSLAFLALLPAFPGIVEFLGGSRDYIALLFSLGPSTQDQTCSLVS